MSGPSTNSLIPGNDALTRAVDSCGATEDLEDHRPAVDAVCATLEASVVARDQQGGTAWDEHAVLRQSGLLTLAVPKPLGGQQASWPLILRILRRIAQSDSSLAHLFGFQHLQVATVMLFGSPEQQKHYLGATVSERWMWGNAVNARDTRLTVRVDGVGYTLDGIKSFCSGTRGSDVMTVSVATGPLPTDRIFAVLPTKRRGITALDDWDAIGQRQTDSGSVRFENVPIHPDELLRDPGPASSPRATLRNMLGQAILTENYLGNALGALRAAGGYAQAHVRPWHMSGSDDALDDSFLLRRTGDLWVTLRGAVALSEHANRHYQEAWDRGLALTEEERGRVSVDVATARAAAASAALKVTSQLFEMVGARATSKSLALDRYWRNVRTHTLHDPIDYRLKDIGRWFLTDRPPNPYSYG